MGNKAVNMDWRKDMVEEGFSQEIGKCVEIDGSADFGESDGKMKMRIRICRIGENELEATGEFDLGDEDEGATTFTSRYRRDVNQ